MHKSLLTWSVLIWSFPYFPLSLINLMPSLQLIFTLNNIIGRWMVKKRWDTIAAPGAGMRVEERWETCSACVMKVRWREHISSSSQKERSQKGSSLEPFQSLDVLPCFCSSCVFLYRFFLNWSYGLWYEWEQMGSLLKRLKFVWDLLIEWGITFLFFWVLFFTINRQLRHQLQVL